MRVAFYFVLEQRFFCVSCRCRDVAPAGYSPFWAARKVSERAAPAARVPSASLWGNLRCSRLGCTAKLSTRLRRSAQTDAVSLSTTPLHSAMQRSSPRPARLGAGKMGGEYSAAFVNDAEMAIYFYEGFKPIATV